MADTEQQKQKLLGGKSTQLPFTVNALQVVVKRYLLKDHADNVLETPEEMFHRVAKALAEVEYKFDAKQEDVLRLQQEFYDLMASFSFTPAGRTLANAGGPTRLVSNCIVLHIQDSLDDIFETLKQAALLQKAGSGLGFPLHLMRPAGFITKTSYGVSSGPISFLHVYNTAFGVIKQQNRHGANMAVMRVDHPDILEFVHCKDREGDLRNFNVSVGLTDKFMRRVRSNDPRPWMCKFRGEKMLPRRVKRDANMSFLSATPVELTAAAMFREIIEAAWRTGEPGCVFLDTVNRTNPLPGLGRLEACNPCGEQFLHDGDVCNLGALNLEKFVTADKKVDFAGLGRATRLAVRMLDNVIELSDFPVEKVHETFASNRRVGLGVMGFADMLYQLNVGYGTAEGRQVASDVMQCIQREAEAESRHLGETKGVFPNWEKSVFAKTGEKRRNAALTNIPPTGTISMMFDVSGGVEPYFALAYYYKNILGGAVQLSYVNKHLKRALVERGIFTEELLAEIIKRGSLQHIHSLPEDLRRTFVTSMDITAEDHIQMQAAFQKHTDNAISKTINFPNSATREDILCGYLSAWELGCKGCTVYRDGSRMEQVLNLNDKKDEKAKEANGHPNGNGVATNGHTNGNGAVKAKASNGTAGTVKGVCKDCNVNLISHEGCAECPQCGTSRCEG